MARGAQHRETFTASWGDLIMGVMSREPWTSFGLGESSLLKFNTQ